MSCYGDPSCVMTAADQPSLVFAAMADGSVCTPYTAAAAPLAARGMNRPERLRALLRPVD